MIQQDLSNRIKKNKKKLKQWVNQFPTNAFRIYDRDLPDFPYIIDCYDQWLIIYEKGRKVEESFSEKKKQILEEVLLNLGYSKEKMVFKNRFKQKRNTQYIDNWKEKESTFQVYEGEAKFIIRPKAYIDQGLFLDHRNLRKHIYKTASKKRVLNLFCYTGSFSVLAHLGGARKVTSVDLSKTYLNWTKENLDLNNCSLNNHDIINDDCLNFLKMTEEKWDIIILDPPSFSNSKKTETILDIQEDHPKFIQLCLDCLNKDGELYFSTNKNKFQIDPKLDAIDITNKTLPKDYSKAYSIHQCFKFNTKNLD